MEESPEGFKKSLMDELINYVSLIDIPIMLRIEGNNSLERLPSQKTEGLDNFILSEGLDIRDNTLKGLEEYNKSYKNLSSRFGCFNIINANQEKEKVFNDIKKVLGV